MKLRRNTIFSACAAVVLILGAGCTSGDPDPGNQSSPESDSHSLDPSEEDSSALQPTSIQPSLEPGGTEQPRAEEVAGDFGVPPVSSENFPDSIVVTEPVFLHDVRFGRHDGYDRIVFEHTGEGTPGFSVEYVEEAFADGSGLPLDVDGDAILEVWVTGVSTPLDPDTGELLDFVDSVQEPDFDSKIEEVLPMPPFEGTAQYLIGLDDEVPIRVAVLADPVRLVIDFATSSKM